MSGAQEAPVSEEIIWTPSAEYVAESNIGRFMEKHGIASFEELRTRSMDIEWFWEACLEDIGVDWYRPYDTLLDTSKGFEWARWFAGGKVNIVHNCIDRHVKAGLGDRIAIRFEADDKEVRTLTYAQLDAEVCRLANAMRAAGVGKGDFCGIYMPMVPEVAVAFFACLKIGAVAIPVFSAFGAPALAARLGDAKAKLLFTADGGYRRAKVNPIKESADRAVAECPSVEKVVVLRRTAADVPWTEGRDVYWHDFVEGQAETCPTEEMQAEDTALVIYTSGTTGRPKGTVHTHAGAMVQMAKELYYAFDLRPETDVFFWVTDIGWMMGPWQMIGVQFFGGTHMLFEGTPNHPNEDRLWETVARHGVTILGISPTAIRLLMTYDESQLDRHDMSAVRLLGSTGEPWDPASYRWYFEKVGAGRAPIMNISGGTEIVGCLLSPYPATPLKPCSLAGPALGMDVDIFDEDGNSLIRGEGATGIGHLVCKQPGPSMTKGFLNDPQRYLDTYFSRFPGVWFHGDWVERDEDGFWFIRGRSDDTMKVAGKRIGPAEIEAALIKHDAVTEAAAIGVPDDVKGQVVVCFAVLRPGREPSEELRKELSDQVATLISKALRPKIVHFVDALPKTRSAKIVRGVIKRKYLGEDVGDVASVENPAAIDGIAHPK
jgi:acetyl-CoA synthetase